MKQFLFLILIFVTPQAFAQDSSSPEGSGGDAAFTKHEMDGDFQKDRFPLLLALQSDQLMSKVKPDCEGVSSKPGKAWGEGFKEALEGQNWAIEVKIGSSTDKYSTKKPERMACQEFRKNADDLNCCLKGYFKAIPILNQRIIDISNNTGKDEKLEHCRRDHEDGARDAKTVCERQGACLGSPMNPVRYLGCYSVGFLETFRKCKNNPASTAANLFYSKNCEAIATENKSQSDDVIIELHKGESKESEAQTGK